MNANTISSKPLNKIFFIKKLGVTICLLFSFATAAELLHFNKQEKEDGYLFNYQWLNKQNKIDNMSFNLPKTSLFDLFRHFKAHKPDIATKYVNHKIRKHLIKNPLPDVTLKYSSHQDEHHFTISGKNQKAIDKAKIEIAHLEKKYLLEYLDSHHYQHFETHDQMPTIKPDHQKFAQRSVQALKPLKPLILSKVSIQNIREVTNFTLGFIQSIPYSTLESRTLSSGVGFNPPLKVLWENQGDCDSKATLAIAILRSLMPRVKLAFIFLKEHALIAIQIPPIGDDFSIKINKESYVLADPTGPHLLSLGEISAEYEMTIRQGQYKAEVFK